MATNLFSKGVVITGNNEIVKSVIPFRNYKHGNPYTPLMGYGMATKIMGYKAN